MFPGAGASVYYNEAGEPLGWDYPDAEPPDYDDFYDRDDYDDYDEPDDYGLDSLAEDAHLDGYYEE